MNKIYIFVISLLNYSVNMGNQEELARNLKIPSKLFTVMNAFKVYSYGGRPIWTDLLVIA